MIQFSCTKSMLLYIRASSWINKQSKIEYIGSDTQHRGCPVNIPALIYKSRDKLSLINYCGEVIVAVLTAPVEISVAVLVAVLATVRESMAWLMLRQT